MLWMIIAALCAAILLAGSVGTYFRTRSMQDQMRRMDAQIRELQTLARDTREDVRTIRAAWQKGAATADYERKNSKYKQESDVLPGKTRNS